MDRQRGARLVWLTLIVGWTLFIFSRSLQDGTHSFQESASVQSILHRLLGDGVVGSFLYRAIRKVAHFAEYGVLGIGWGGYSCRFRAVGWWLWIAGPLTAAADECLQFFAPGRSPQIRDVLLDSVGYACGVAAMLLLRLLVSRYKRRAER